MKQYLDTWSQKKEAGKLNLFQKAKLKVPSKLYNLADNFLIALNPKKAPQTIQTLIGTLDQTKLARAVDISHWNGDVDVKRMVSEGGLSMLFAKCSDGRQVVDGSNTDVRNYVDDWHDRNCQKAYDVHIPYCPYHYVQPYLQVDYTVTDTANWNMRTLHAALDNKVPNVSYHAIMLDVEQKSGTDPNASDVVLQMIAKIAADPKMSQVPLIIYSSISCLNFYNKLMQQTTNPSVAGKYNYMMAQWVYNTARSLTWTDLITSVIPGISMKVMLPGYLPSWKFLQWAACYTLPGCNGALDQIFYNGTKEALYSWLDYDATPVPTPTPPPPPTTDLETRVALIEIKDAQRDSIIADLQEAMGSLTRDLANLKSVLQTWINEQ